MLAEGLYKDIKSNIVNAGGKYHRSVYVMLEDGTIANLSFKGAVVREWSDFMEANRSLTDAQWIEVKEAREEKKVALNIAFLHSKWVLLYQSKILLTQTL